VKIYNQFGLEMFLLEDHWSSQCTMNHFM